MDTYNSVNEIFNVISYSADPRWKENVKGYTYPDVESCALKIRYIADAWQRLVVSDESPLSITMSIVVHRITGFQGTTNLLSSTFFGRSYTNICRETKKLVDDARNDSSLAPATISKVQITHITIDNSSENFNSTFNNSLYQFDNLTVLIPQRTQMQNLLLKTWT